MSVEFVEYFDGINEDMHINIIHCRVLFDGKPPHYYGVSRAYWVYKTGNEQAEIEAARDKFLSKFIRGKKFDKVKLELVDSINSANNRSLLIKGIGKK